MQANDFQEWWKIENQRMAKRVVPLAASEAAAEAEAESVLQLLLLFAAGGGSCMHTHTQIENN